MHLFSFTLIFSTCYLLVRAGKQNSGQNCTLLHNRLETGSLQFFSDCDAQNYCSGQGICEPKGCRTELFPFGYAEGADLPPMCPSGQFCPDESDACQPLLPVGSPCQLNRDDQCAPPSSSPDVADASHYGVNVDGAVCLKDVCMWANVTVGQACMIENTAYIVYTSNNEFIDVVSRDNCHVGLYCDGNQLICMQAKSLSVSCSADKECASFNCDEGGTCVDNPSTPHQYHIYVYILAGVGIFGGMFGTLFGMSWLHRRQREAEREKRANYWREQDAFRQSIHQMQETARLSVASMGGVSSKRNTMHSAISDDSSRPMLPRSVTKPSGLRHYIADDESS